MKEILHIKMAGGEYSFDLPKITLLRGKSFKNPGKDNIKCERKRKPPDALFFYLKSTEREVRTCETTDI